jgi:BA14K-like protein
MKSLLVLLGSLGFSLMTFIGGLVVATVLFNVSDDSRPLGDRDVANLWTNQPVRVDPRENGFERLPAVTAPDAPAQPATVASAGGSAIETASAAFASEIPEKALSVMPTGAVAPDETIDEQSDLQIINEAHLDWCSNRYRSYRPRDNSYTPFSGGRRECVSPFTTSSDDLSEQTAASIEALSPLPERSDSYTEETSSEIIEASLGSELSPEHVEACFTRYRSYSPQDNSYQPYGGGPRQPCQ